MPVVKLTRGEDEWLVQVGDLEPDKRITDEEAKAHALRQANGDGKDFLPSDDKGEWTVVSVHGDHENFQEMYGVTDEQVRGSLPTEADPRLNR
jgi:hypothetical protein